MPAAISTRQVAIVQPQRRDTSDHIEAISSSTMSVVTNMRLPRTSKSDTDVSSSVDNSDEDKVKPKSPKTPQFNLQNTTKATLWIESRKTSPRKSVKESPARIEITPRKAISAKKSTPLRMTVLKRAQSAQKMRVTKIEAPLTVDHTKQAAIMLMTGHTPKQKGRSPKQSSPMRASYVVKKPSPVKKTPRKSSRLSKNSSSASVKSIRASLTTSERNSTRRSSQASLDQSSSVMDVSDPGSAAAAPRRSALRRSSTALRRAADTIKFDLSNLSPREQTLRYADSPAATSPRNLTDSPAATSPRNLTDSPAATSPRNHTDSPAASSPRRPQSRSSRMLERSLGLALPAPESVETSPKPESPRSRKSLRGSIMLQKVLETPDDSSATYSRRSTRTLAEQSDTVASARRTRTLSPRGNMESYSIVDLVSLDSNDSRAGSVYDSVSSADTSASKFDTPQGSVGRRTRSVVSRGRSLLASSTPAVKKNYEAAVSRSRSAIMSLSYDSIPDNSLTNSVVSTRRSKSLSAPEQEQNDATFNISEKPRQSSKTLDNISINSTRISRQSKSFATHDNAKENATFNVTRKSRTISSQNISDSSMESTKKSRKSNSIMSPVNSQENTMYGSSRKSRKSNSVMSPENTADNISIDSSRKSKATPRNSQENVTLGQSKSRALESVSALEISEDDSMLNSTRKSRSSRASRLRASEADVASLSNNDTAPRSSKRNINSTPHISPLQGAGMSTPKNQNSPEEIGTPVISIQSLLDSSFNSTKSRLSKSKGTSRLLMTRKTIGSRLSVPTKHVSIQSKSFNSGTRGSSRGSRKSKNTSNMDEDLTQDDGDTTPKSAVKLVQEAVKNKHSTAKKPQSKRSIIDNLNESDIVKQLFNSPVKRKLSQSMMEFSRKQLLDDEDEMGPTKRPARNTIALTGRTPENSLLEQSQAFTPEVFVSPLSTPSHSPNLTGLKRLFAKSTPENDLRNVRGVKKLLQTPRYRRSIQNDLSNVTGVKALFAKSPRNRLSDVRVKEVFAVSPKNDLRRVSGVKSLFRAQKKNKSPKNSLEDVTGVRNVFKKNSPRNELLNVSGVKDALRRKSPRNDLSDVRGLRRLFRQEKLREGLNDISGIEELFSESHQTSKLTGTNAESSFDLLIGKAPVRSYPKAKSFSDRLIQKPKTRKAHSLHTSFSSITNNVEDWLENELRNRMHGADAGETSALKSMNKSNSSKSVTMSKANKSIESVSIFKEPKRASRNKSDIATSATKKTKSVNSSLNHSADKTEDGARRSKSGSEGTPTKGLNKSRSKINASRELQKLATDTVQGCSPVLSARARSSACSSSCRLEAYERKRSTSEIYGAHMLPIKKRSLVDASASGSKERSALPIKKRVVMHSTPVKGRADVTMDASDIGRVSPIARDANVHGNRESVTRPTEVSKESPERKTIQTRKSKLITAVENKKKSSEPVERLTKNIEEAQKSPVQRRATRGRKTKENLEMNNVKKRRSSLVISKKMPVLSPKPAKKASPGKPVPEDKAEAIVTKETRRRNLNQKQDVEEGTARNRKAAQTVSQETEIVSRGRKSVRKPDANDDKESSTIEQLPNESPVKSRTTRRQKTVVDKVETPKKTTRGKVQKGNVVISKPSPQMKPRSAKRSQADESEKSPEIISKGIRKTGVAVNKPVTAKRKHVKFSKEPDVETKSMNEKNTEEDGSKRKGRKGKEIDNVSQAKEKEIETGITRPKRGRKTIAQDSQANANEAQTRSTRNAAKETVSDATKTRGKKTASEEIIQSAPKRQLRTKDTETETIAENKGKGSKRKMTLQEEPNKLRKINTDDDTSRSTRRRKAEKESPEVQQNTKASKTKIPEVAEKSGRGKKNESLKASKERDEEVVEPKRGRGGKKNEKALEANAPVGRKKTTNKADAEAVELKTRGRSKKQSIEVNKKSIEVKGKRSTRKMATDSEQGKTTGARKTTRDKPKTSSAPETQVKTRQKKAAEPEKPQSIGRKRKINIEESAAKDAAPSGLRRRR